MKWFWHRNRMESEMDEELRFHIDSYASDLMKQGIAKDEAFRRARMEFGAIEARKEECRESLGLRLWDELRSDLRGGIRILRQSPVFTAVAVISLALGIGANTAIFSLANEILFRTMAVPHPERLRLFSYSCVDGASMWGSCSPNDEGEVTGTSFPYPLFAEMQRTNRVMEDLTAFMDIDGGLSVSADRQAEGVGALLVSGNFYQAMGVRVEAGRGILPADDVPGAVPVIVISDAYWTRRFARSAGALGKTIKLNRIPVTIVGVNAPEFKGAKALGKPEVFVPLSLQPQVIPNPRGSLLTQNSVWWVLVMGRLKAGVSDQAATAALSASFRNAFRATIPGTKEKDIPRFHLARGDRGLDLWEQPGAKKPIYLLLAVTGLVLLIACANLANILLARAAARQREISLRLAMGAGRGRILRQMLTESMILAFLGGAAGLILEYGLRNVIPGLFDNPWRPSSLDLQMDWRVFLFAFSISVVTGLLFGLGPAWHSTNGDANAALKETNRIGTGHSKALFGKALVVLQVALSLLLLVGAGLFVRTLLNLRSAPTGIDPEHIVLFQVVPPESQYSPEQRVVLYQRITEGLAAMPGAQRVTSSNQPLLAQSEDSGCFRPVGGTRQRSALMNAVGTNFFETFGIPILSGRSLTLHDDRHGPKVAVINEALARAFFPKGNALGQTIESCDGKPQLIQVVGISRNTKYASVRDDVPATIYLPYTQADDIGWMTFEVKTAASLASVVPKIRAVVKAVDPDLPVLNVRTQTEQIDATLSEERGFATLTTCFGLLALLLASIGIYGVMAYTVSRRTNEIGIRMALGAQARQVLRMVLAESSVLAVIGIIAGLAAALAATRVLTSMLFGVKPTDPATFCAAAALLLLVALLSALVPAWRAATVEPITALRHE